MPTLLALEHLHLAYDTARGLRTVVPDLNLELERGQIGCLLGASGCGKSTVLRAIAGFEPVRGGRIVLEGRVLSSPQQQVAPELRRVGMMFQDYALFPHMTVAGNVGFGLRRASPQERAARVGELLELVGLSMPRTVIRTSSRAASDSAWPWPAPWPPRPSCCCWTNPSPTWTPTPASTWRRGAPHSAGHRPHGDLGHAQPGRSLGDCRPHWQPVRRAIAVLGQPQRISAAAGRRTKTKKRAVSGLINLVSDSLNPETNTDCALTALF